MRTRISVLAVLLAAGLRAQDGRPNLLFIMADDHAAHALSCYGSRINETPNLDRLAREGMLFRNCFCTNSLCGPSRATILTGKYSHRNGFARNGDRFDGAQSNVAKLLRKAGYETAVIGKWHLGTAPTGFDYHSVLPGQGRYYDPDFLVMGKRQRFAGYVTDVITDLVLDWLKSGRDPKKPFFLMYHHKAPHRRWQPGPQEKALFSDHDVAEPVTLDDDWKGRGTAAHSTEMTIEHHLQRADVKGDPPAGLAPAARKRWYYQRFIKDYLRCVAGVDRNVGRVLDWLDRSGLAANTVVVYTSDQGFFLGDHGWFDKRFMYEESLRMPLLVRYPAKVAAGSVNTDIVLNLDFAETFLDLAGARVPAGMQGRSLRPLLAGETPADWRTSMYYRYYEYPAVHSVRRHYGVRTRRYKLIRFQHLDEWELYDLEKDPHELRSVWGDPAYADIVAGLTGELTRLRARYGDDDSVWNPFAERAKEVRRDLVLRYDFAGTRPEGTGVRDASGKGHDGRLDHARWVEARGGAVELDGAGSIRVTGGKSLDPAFKPLAAGAWCRLRASDGVIVAFGGARQGFALWVDGGIPCFGIRSSGRLAVARAASRVRIGEWVHLAGTLGADGLLRVWVDGKEAGKRAGAPFLTSRPADELTIGADTGSRVGRYRDAAGLHGALADVRVYWGPVGATLLRAWMGPR